VKLFGYSFGQVVTVGVMATIFALALSYVGKRWPKAPVVGAVSRSLYGRA
jgi:hypothetical protein